MHYREIAPAPQLRGLVHRIWLLRGHRGSSPAPFQRAMPDGRAELIFNLADPFEAHHRGRVDAQPPRLLVGPSRQAMEIRPTGDVDLVGVRFRPEALTAWLRATGGELVDGAYSADDLPLPIDGTLAEQLAEAADAESRVALLQRQLSAGISRVAFDRRIGFAVELAMADGRARPSAVAGAVGLSHRQLNRLFRERVGIGLKPLVRLGRFQRVLRALELPGRQSLAGAALRAGYFDQAHMARDFRLFAGISPGRYLRETRELTRNFIAEEETDGGFFQDAGASGR